MHPLDVAYAAALRVAPGALRVVAPFSAKLRRGLAGRAAAVASLTRWAAAHRDPRRPLVWLHAPSVGEGLMAQAILAAVRTRRDDAQFIFTYFSPSAERIAARVGADWSGYLPWDRRADVDRALSAADPAVVAFVRTEIWPVLIARAQQRGARAVLVNAALASGSSRLRMPARLLLRRAYAALDAAGAISADDARRLRVLGVPADRLHVTGDARFDQVWWRVQAFDPASPLVQPFRDGTMWLVCGSTWAPDEERLVAALVAARTHGAAWRAVMAPHEPTEPHLRALEQRLAAAGLTYARLPRAGDALPLADVLVVDRIGVLAELYAVAAAAYVGGGFGTAGLHSVVEPAALGVPVIYGPRHGNAQEAERLRQSGGGTVVDDVASLTRLLITLRDEPEIRSAAGESARGFVRSHTGGATGNAELILSGLGATTQA